MMIEVNYVHFHNLNRNVLDLGKQVRELSEDKARYMEMCDELDARCNELKSDVDRLTKAGDAMASHVRVYCSCFVCEQLIEAWNAAKEGKQP